MLLDFVHLEKNSGNAMYLQLYSEIKAAAVKGIIKPGERLPSIREAAAQLGVSRTTAESAYLKLCIEGLAESSPQRGYFICAVPSAPSPASKPKGKDKKILYDFSARNIDPAAADIDLWKRMVRGVLRDTGELTSYGDPQGEEPLRRALAAYSYKARGVVCRPENIVTGAGVGPLLNILCGLIGRDMTVGFEFGGFPVAEQIFEDYGIRTVPLDCDKSGALPSALKKSGADILMLMPSALSKISVAGLARRRAVFAEWAENGGLIIEDDYNGELRYTARSVPAFQGKSPDRTVYIGSFSKLLLPSVRIAYMVLPDSLLEKFTRKKNYYNQTCGKTEQSALRAYIESGALEKHLRKLRKLYYAKSRSFLKAVGEVFPEAEVTLYESSLTAGICLPGNPDFGKSAEACGIRPAGFSEDELRLSFAGINEEDFLPALKLLKNNL